MTEEEFAMKKPLFLLSAAGGLGQWGWSGAF
jgi:hypothetical protein